MSKARTVYIVNDDDTQTVHATAAQALKRFSGGSWSVVPPSYPGVTIPVSPRNLRTLVSILEAEGYVEFTNNGLTRINAAQLYED